MNVKPYLRMATGLVRRSGVLPGVGVWLATLSASANLALTEIHYNPAPPTSFEQQLGYNDANLFEFLEFTNLGNTTISLNNVAILLGVTFDFANSPIQSLAPGARVVVVNNVVAFRVRYSSVTAIAGAYSGQLANSGETLAWRQPSGFVEYLEYSDRGMWSNLADGKGWSLHRQNPNIPAANPAAWRPSLWRHGSPASSDPAPSGVVLNEIMTHTDPPLLDMIEIFNGSGQTVDISGWRLSDDADALAKYVIPNGTLLAAGAYWTVTEQQFNDPNRPADQRFGLNASEGERVYMSAEGGGNVRMEDVADLGAQYNGESFGRWPNGSGAWHPQALRSFGAANTGVKTPRLVITEIHFNPGAPQPTWEFIEITNLEPFTLSLQNWRLTLGVDYFFPPSVQLAPGKTLLVVPFNPTLTAPRDHFINTWGMPADTPMLGISTGQLSDAGEYVALTSPDAPPASNPTLWPAVVEDLTFYTPYAPWPTAAAGQGQSLQRADRRTAGTLGSAWFGAMPTPGRVPFLDEDSDGIADDWELRLFGNRVSAQGRATDADGDHFSDWHEYVANTDPFDPASLLALTQTVYHAANQTVGLSWEARPPVRYSIHRAATPGGTWTQVVSDTPGPSISLPVPTAGSAFYRIQAKPSAP